jgi:hypothetical protein
MDSMMSMASLKKISDFGNTGLINSMNKQKDDSQEKDMFRLTLSRMQSFDPKSIQRSETNNVDN